jgi:hypothetical protein
VISCDFLSSGLSVDDKAIKFPSRHRLYTLLLIHLESTDSAYQCLGMFWPLWISGIECEVGLVYHGKRNALAYLGTSFTVLIVIKTCK